METRLLPSHHPFPLFPFMVQWDPNSIDSILNHSFLCGRKEAFRAQLAYHFHHWPVDPSNKETKVPKNVSFSGVSCIICIICVYIYIYIYTCVSYITCQRLGWFQATFLRRPALAVCARMLAAILSPNLERIDPGRPGQTSCRAVGQISIGISRPMLQLVGKWYISGWFIYG